MLRLALPSKGELEEPTLAFLESCGLSVERPSTRHYTAGIPALGNVVVLFQRAADIPSKVEEGSADLGITGLDTVYETRREDGESIVILEDLGYGRCDLVVAVPESWIDVTAMADLAELAVEMRERGKELRVATKYPRLTQRFFFSKGLNYFALVPSTGAMEAAPTIGFADIIADLTASGTTLRENGLKPVGDGTILHSQACLIGNIRLLGEHEERLGTTKEFLELVEARLRAATFYRVSGNVRGPSPEAIANHILSKPQAAGIQGPTIAKVYSRNPQEQDWYEVTMMVQMGELLGAIEHLRQIGGRGISVFSTSYVFETEATSYHELLKALEEHKVQQREFRPPVYRGWGAGLS